VARRLIVDTGVLVAAERGGRFLSEVVFGDDDLVIAAITVAELWAGVELAMGDRRSARAELLTGILDTLPVEAYGLQVAEAHGRLLAHVHRTGTKRGAHDLIIAATALTTRRIVLTTDRNARFGELPGVECLLVG
jgi:tRNA(fMet)-specific endonuclease VapC